MKLKKFSILAFIFTTTISTAFANTYDYADVNVNVKPFLSIAKADGSVTNGVVKATSSNLEFTTPIATSYNIYANDPLTISLSATAPTSTGDVNALYGTAANAMTIVFTKSNSSATADSVSNAGSSSASASSNANAVAFTFTASTPTVISGSAPTVGVADNSLRYAIPKGASFNLPISVSGSALNDTFSNADTGGEYQATLVISRVDG